MLVFLRQAASELRALLDAAEIKALTVAETGDAMLHAASASAARMMQRAEEEAATIRGAAELELQVVLGEAQRIDAGSRAQVRAIVQRAEEEVDALFQRAKTRCEELWRMESERIHDAETTVRRLHDGFGGRAVATAEPPTDGDGRVSPRPVTSEEANRLLDAYLSGDASRLEQEAEALAQAGVPGLTLLRNGAGNGDVDATSRAPAEIAPAATAVPPARPVAAKAPKPSTPPPVPTAVPAIVGRSEGTLLSRRVGRVGTVGDLALIFLLSALVVLLAVWLSRPM